jgi:parvulin-like peptidyl-prolyl isomerase
MPISASKRRCASGAITGPSAAAEIRLAHCPTGNLHSPTPRQGSCARTRGSLQKAFRDIRNGVRFMASSAHRFKSVRSLLIATTIGVITQSPLLAQQTRTGAKSPAGAANQTAPKVAAKAGPSPAMTDKKNKGLAKELEVVAVVNGLQITRQKLADECLHRYGKEVLDTRIHKQLILAECQARKIVITEQDVDDEVARMAAKFRLPVDKYVQLIQNERDVPIEQYRSDIIWPTLALRFLAESELSVSKAELQKQWETEFGAKVKCSVIVSKSKEIALKLRSKCLADPEEFGNIAKDESIDRQSASVMGSIPPIARHVHDIRVEKAAFALKPGEISEVIMLPDLSQYLILKCEKHIPQVFVPDEAQADAKQRIEDRIREQKSMTVAANVCEQLQKKAKVRTIYTDPKLADEQPGVMAMINGAPVTRLQLAEDCIGRFGKQVLEGEINRTMLEGALKERKTKVSQQMIDSEMVKAAREGGYLKTDNKTPDVDAWLQAAAEQWAITPDLYISDYVWNTCAMKLLVTDEIEVTEAEIKKAFEANYGPRARVLAIVGSDERRMKEVWNMAMQDPKQSTFGQLASQYSEETVSRSNMGMIPPVPRHSGRQKLEDAAFKLKPNEISAVIQVDATYYVIMYGLGLTDPLLKKMDAAVREELVSLIKERKQVEMMTAAYDNLRESADILNFLSGETQNGKKPVRSAAAPAGSAPRAGARPTGGVSARLK